MYNVPGELPGKFSIRQKSQRIKKEEWWQCKMREDQTWTIYVVFCYVYMRKSKKCVY